MATRRSSRLDAKASAAAVETTQLVQNETPTIGTQGSGSLKRRKTAHEKGTSSDNALGIKSNRRGIKRKTRDSPFSKDVPLDILFEIFKLLEPIDLLHLSRVSKNLHGLLSSNDMVFLWKLAYENIAEAFRPPLCPDDINVVLYTNYLYGRHCQFCCSIHGKIHHDSALIRLCSNCADDGFVNVDGLDPSVSCLCNVSTVPKRKPASRFVFKVEYDLRTKELNRARENKEEESYSTDRKADVQDRASLSRLLGEWRDEIQSNRLLQVRLIRAERERDISKRLEEEGYKDDFDLSHYWLSHIPHVRKSHALTDSEWSIIRADILDYFQDFRDYQALYNMKEKFLTRVRGLEAFMQQWKIRPPAWWIVTSSEPIASLIKSQPDEELSDEHFENFKTHLRTLILSWKEETDRYLTSLISDAGKQKNSSNQTNRLKLATTFFRCRHCEAFELISYPEILMHDCFLFGDDESVNEEGDFKGNKPNTRKPRGPREPRPPKHISADTVLTTLTNSHRLGMCAGTEGVSFDKRAYDAARDIITACGEDPDTVTHDSMRRSRLECTRCEQVSVQHPRKWLSAVLHELEHKSEHTSSKHSWRKIDAPETKKKSKRK